MSDEPTWKLLEKTTKDSDGKTVPDFTMRIETRSKLRPEYRYVWSGKVIVKPAGDIEITKMSPESVSTDRHHPVPPEIQRQMSSLPAGRKKIKPEDLQAKCNEMAQAYHKLTQNIESRVLENQNEAVGIPTKAEIALEEIRKLVEKTGP